MFRILQNFTAQNCGKNIHAVLNTYSRAFACNADYLCVSQESGVREIMLDDAKTRNSLSMGMMNALHTELNKDLNDVNLRCIVLTANGKIWSAGHNLRELNTSPDQQTAIFKRLADIIFSIFKAPVPVIAKVSGLAAAAGCQLVASCDIIVCSETAQFSTPGANFGIFCSTPGIAISRVMPHPKASLMLMTGLPISGKEAYIAGLASVAVPETQLDAEVEKITNAIKSKSRSVLALGKTFYYKQRCLPIQQAYEEGANKMTENLQLGDSKEGLKSFIEKRKPSWTHN